MINGLDRRRFGIAGAILGFLIAGSVVQTIESVLRLQEARREGQMKRINNFIPSFVYLSELSAGKVPPQEKTLDRCVLYYHYLSKDISRSDDVLALKGFCSYYLGREDEAISLYQEAIRLKDDFFWHYYNLGVLYFLKGEYQKSQALLKRALMMAPEKTLQNILSSKVYRQILAGLAQKGKNHHFDMRQAYQDLLLLLALDSLFLEDFPLAKQYLQMAQDLNRKEGWIIDLLAGMAAYHLNDYPSALEYLKKIIKNRPQEPLVRYYLKLAERSQDRPAAIQEVFASGGQFSLGQIVKRADLRIF